MSTDPRKLRPGELCRLINSTPEGEVITERQLKRHRTRGGLRIGDARHVDLVRYAAWLVHVRHSAKPQQSNGAEDAGATLQEAAEGAAALGSEAQLGHGRKLTAKQEALIAALLTEPTYASAAAKAGVSPATLYRWMHLPAFRAAYRQARRELVETAVGRIQAATGHAIEVLVSVARQGRRDGDRVRAAVALLDRAFRGLTDAELVHGDVAVASDNENPLNTADVVKLVSTRLQQLEQTDLPASEKSRLTATLADALLRAISVDVLEKRLEALHNVLTERKDKN